MVRIEKGALTGGTRVRANCSELPILIIDGLAKSLENQAFVGGLCEHVRDSNMSALILVKEETWADELIKVNGGVKILPVDQVVNNPRGDNVYRRFTDKSQWKSMVWGLDDIKAFAGMAGMGGIIDVTLRENMTPEQVLDLQERDQNNREVVLQSGQDE